MKNILVRIVFYYSLFLSCIPSVAKSVCNNQRSFRVMTYNVRNGLGMDMVKDLDRLSEAIVREKPDFIALQEIDSATARNNGVDILREIALRTKMYYQFAPAIDFDGGKYGVGIMSRVKPLSTHYIPLPGREEERTVLVAEFDKFLLACTHLSLTAEDRMASLDIIRRKADNSNKPFILTGDFNARPGSSFINELQEDFTILSDTTQMTFPADVPKVCIDYITAYNKKGMPFTLTSTAVCNEPMASDHRPVIADLVVKASQSEIFRTSPYLQNPVGEGITVMWQTNVPTYSWVEYGTDTVNLKKVHTLVDGQVVANGYHNKIRITGLVPGKRYYYRVCSKEITLYQAYKKEFGETAVSGFSSFTLPSAGDDNFTAIIFNDLHKQTATLNALYEQVKDIPYDLVFFNGDCIDDPENEDEALEHLAIQCNKVGANNIPVIYLRGNHEIRGAYSIGLRNLFDYIGDKTYSAFNWGDTRIVMLDCGEDKPDDTWVYYGLNDFSQLQKDQREFLQKELSGKYFKQAKRRVLINHIPLYGNGDDYQPCPLLWGDLLEKAPFDINISGHTHRFAYHQKKEKNNNFPVVIGGGHRMDRATVMILTKKGKEMSLRVVDTQGNVLLELSL